jgi:uncharacterized membrane protein YkgB
MPNLAAAFLYAAIAIIFVGVMVFVFTLAGQQIGIVLNNVPGYNTYALCGNATNQVPCFPGHQKQTPLNDTITLLNYNYKFDQWIPLIFIIVNIGIIAGVILVETSYLSLAIAFVLQIVTVFVAIILSNSLQPLFTSNVFATVAPHFPQTIGLYAQLPAYEIAFTLIFILVIAAKVRGIGGGLGGSGGYTSATI